MCETSFTFLCDLYHGSLLTVLCNRVVKICTSFVVVCACACACACTAAMLLYALEWTITDNDSVNGLFLNRRRIRKATLQ